MFRREISRSPYAKFRKLDILDNKVMAQYIWIDGTGQNLRSKTKTIECGPGDVQIDDCPDWNFDGANTDQAYGPETDCWLRPAAVFRDPFRGGNNKLVLCEVYNTDWRPDQRNHRGSCLDVMNLPEVEAAEPWFGMRQVYSIFDKSSAPHSVFSLEHPSLSSNYYCGVGYNRSYLRSLIESHYKACLFAGVNIAGANDEFVPSQKEFQIGPCRGIDMGDHLWIARYILQRVSEEFGVVISFDMHSQTGNSMGAHCHTNFSTIDMRQEDGIKAIDEAVGKMTLNFDRHVRGYNLDDNLKYSNATNKTGDSATSKVISSCIRIPPHCSQQRKGYLEDRRPPSNCDPYMVTERIVRTCILNERS